MLSNHLSLCHPLLLLPSVFPRFRVFSSASALTSGGQSIGTSASVLPVNTQGWFPSGLIHLISLQSKGLSRVLSNTTIWKHQFFGAQPSLQSNSHPYTTMGKNHSFDICQMFVCKVMSLLFNMLCRIVIAFFSKEQASFNFMAVGTVLWFWSPRT